VPLRIGCNKIKAEKISRLNNIFELKIFLKGFLNFLNTIKKNISGAKLKKGKIKNINFSLIVESCKKNPKSLISREYSSDL
jgi:hypothetical protein